MAGTLTLGEKSALVIGTGVGTAVPILLQGIDASLAIDWVKTGKGKDPESYPLYMRPGIMVPNILGPIALLVGILGNEWFSKREDGPAIQGALLVMGTGMTVGGLGNLSTALDGRKKAGVPMTFPKPDIAYNTNCAWRSIGGPGYMVGCLGNAAGSAANPIVDPPINFDTRVQQQPQNPGNPGTPPPRIVPPIPAPRRANCGF
jgi:hypothetical protein